jgi:hypothetical protein
MEDAASQVLEFTGCSRLVALAALRLAGGDVLSLASSIQTAVELVLSGAIDPATAVLAAAGTGEPAHPSIGSRKRSRPPEPAATGPEEDKATTETDKAWRRRLSRRARAAAANGSASAPAVTAPAAALGVADEDTDLRCPFQDKDAAKELGARFDFQRKVWYVPEGEALTPFRRWLPARHSNGAPPAPRWHGYPNQRPENFRLRVASWNVAELVPSQVAPGEWGENSQLRGVRQTVRAARPDVVLLQECPSSRFEIDPARFVRCGSAPSHCGYVCVYVRREWKRPVDVAPGEDEDGDEEAATAKSTCATPSSVTKFLPLPDVAQIILFEGLPAVGLLLDFGGWGHLCIVNVHLAPHREGAPARDRQLGGIGRMLHGGVAR